MCGSVAVLAFFLMVFESTVCSGRADAGQAQGSHQSAGRGRGSEKGAANVLVKQLVLELSIGSSEFVVVKLRFARNAIDWEVGMG